ncbi:hypothetical protein QCA50_011940 [Cerrena zonata]|uniref:Zn(2)-C6 fungal-type domain-containing protein n=1 Tax=Cerrena zonata TaxID=2478898 RepID=A0AAW0FU04_9APHY
MSGSRRYPALRMKISTSEASSEMSELTSPSSASPLSTTSGSSRDSASPKTPTEMSTDAMFQLVPYDVPWGSQYYRYKVGSLPGPGGSCVFLRTPTPVDKRRTVQACTTCRERKAKCSGSRPSCARCISRGLECEYAPVMPISPMSDTRPTRDISLPKQQLRDARRHSDPYPRRPRDSSMTLSNPRYREAYSPSSIHHHTHLKIETETFPTLSPSPAPSSSTLDYSPSSYYSPIEAATKTEIVNPDYNFNDVQSNTINSYELPEIQISHAAVVDHTTPALHAPQPRKLSVSGPTISSLEVRVADSNQSVQFLESDGSTLPSSCTVDPRMLSGEQFLSHPHEYMAAPYSAFPTSAPPFSGTYDAGSSKDTPWQYSTGYEDSTQVVSQRYYCVDMSTYSEQPMYENMYYCQPTTSYQVPTGYSFTVPLGYPTALYIPV